MNDVAATEQKMSRALQALERDLGRIRPGAASASILDDIHVDHLGRRVRLTEVATVSIPDPRQILIQPWDPASLRAIGTAISQSRSGLTPTIDGRAIRIHVPAMTEDRRRELVDIVHRRVEQARVDIRAIRHEALANARASEHDRSVGVDDRRREIAALQRATDRYVDAVDRLGEAKVASLLRL